MFVILYNPKSFNDTLKVSLKLKKKLEKKHETAEIKNIIDLNDKFDSFLSETPLTDKIVIVGGDGTIHRFINNIRGIELKHRFFLYESGRGNDFSRGHKGKFFEITEEIKNLPTCEFAGNKHSFINGMGIGIDAAVCHEQNKNIKKNTKESYYKIAKRLFLKFKPFELDLVLDGKDVHFDKVWFMVVQNGKYFGGGMKIAPKALRSVDTLEVVVVHGISIRKLFMVFPLIFIGKHTICKKGITFFRSKTIDISAKGFDIMQMDGDTVEGVSQMKIY